MIKNYPFQSCPNCNGKFVRDQNKIDRCQSCKSAVGVLGEHWFNREFEIDDHLFSIDYYLETKKTIIYKKKYKDDQYGTLRSISQLDFLFPFDITIEQLKIYLQFI